MSVFYEPENYRCLLLLLLLSIVSACAVLEQDESVEEIMDDIIHSDLPIFGNGGDNEWPRHFDNEDSFGCTSRVAFGDWVFRESDVETARESDWYRFSNYGVFHCRANVSHAYTREALEHAQNHPSFFVRLGELYTDDREIELWVIQIGARPGSDYMLLSRASGEGVIEEFTVLQSECPRANVRDAGSLDILLTRYCAINSRAELIRLARRMAKRPPLGTLVRDPIEGEN